MFGLGLVLSDVTFSCDFSDGVLFVHDGNSFISFALSCRKSHMVDVFNASAFHRIIS